MKTVWRKCEFEDNFKLCKLLGNEIWHRTFWKRNMTETITKKVLTRYWTTQDWSTYNVFVAQTF